MLCQMTVSSRAPQAEVESMAARAAEADWAAECAADWAEEAGRREATAGLGCLVAVCYRSSTLLPGSLADVRLRGASTCETAERPDPRRRA